MSSGFVSGGTNDAPVERDDEWLRVQQELEEERRRKAELRGQDGGKSLFEVLEQNKMAKQEAFEEKIKLKNQFRALDEDEVDYLDSILESTRAQEAAVKKDTADQLEVFRRQREEAEKALLEDTAADVKPPTGGEAGEDWNIPARKRRRDKKQDLLIPGKKRKSLSEGEKKVNESLQQRGEKDVAAEVKTAAGSETASSRKITPQDSQSKQPPLSSKDTAEGTDKTKTSQPEAKQPVKTAPLSLGLAGYSSDSE